MFHNNQPITATVADIGATLIQIKILLIFILWSCGYTIFSLQKKEIYKYNTEKTHFI
jgi:hypothetical protein